MIGWATPDIVAALCARPERTIRTWAARGQITTKRDPDTGRILVDYFEVRDKAATAKVWWDKKRGELTPADPPVKNGN